jgi:alkanesulfonate monooxygenase SsuD/methylene tetrahydromethanopterin reductase-like flavin-dependent oxidoreductase (luciferase family)
MVDEMLSVSAVGSPETVRRGLETIVTRTGADELMLTSQIFDHASRLRSYELTAAAQVEAAPSA